MNILNRTHIIFYYLTSTILKHLNIQEKHFFVLILRAFRIYDDDHSLSLNLDEFSTGLADYGVELSEEVQYGHKIIDSWCTSACKPFIPQGWFAFYTSLHVNTL